MGSLPRAWEGGPVRGVGPFPFSACLLAALFPGLFFLPVTLNCYHRCISPQNFLFQNQLAGSECATELRPVEPQEAEKGFCAVALGCGPLAARSGPAGSTGQMPSFAGSFVLQC